MSFSLIPKRMAGHLYDLTPAVLRQSGITFLMLDFDNTIVPYTSDTPTEPMAQWLEQLMDSGIGICVVSNSKRDRVMKFCRARHIPCITHSKKPFSKGIRQCMDRFHLDPAHTALVGDQIYTDTLGANCMGVTSILVKAIDNHTFWLKARHVLELPFIFLAGNRRLSQ